MIAQHVCMPFCGWCVDIFYDVRPIDADFILDKLWSMGCAQKHMYHAEDLLRSGKPNQGLTYSDKKNRHSIIVVGHASSPFEFLDTLSHEKQHLEQAICQADRLDPYGEDIAYISGNITEAIARDAWYAMRKLFRYLI